MERDREVSRAGLAWIDRAVPMHGTLPPALARARRADAKRIAEIKEKARNA